MATATMTRQDVQAKLEAARLDADAQRSELDRAEGELAQAVEVHDYERANTLNQRVAELRPGVAVAEASVKALGGALQQLADHERQQRTAAEEKARKEAAETARAEAMAGERQAMERAQELLSEGRDLIRQAGAKFREALAAEGTAGTFRQQAHQAAVDAGLEEESAFGVALPNNVSAALEWEPLLMTVLRSTS